MSTAHRQGEHHLTDRGEHHLTNESEYHLTDKVEHHLTKNIISPTRVTTPRSATSTGSDDEEGDLFYFASHTEIALAKTNADKGKGI